MNKAFRSFSLVILCLLVLGSIVLGCSKGSEENEKAAPTNSAASNAAETAKQPAADLPEVNKDGVPTWPYDKEPVTIDWFVDFGWFDSKWDEENTELHRLIKEETGISLNLMSSAGGGEGKLNTLIASGSLPDVITMSNTSPQFALLLESGKIMDMKPLIAKYVLPDYNNLPKTMIDWYTNDEGKLFTIANNFLDPDKMDERNYYATNTGMYARKDIMDKLGITADEFTTQEGFIQALKKVKDAKVEYNGQIMAPLQLGALAGVPYTWNKIMPDMFAIPKESESGELLDTRFHPKTLEMLKFGNRLFREGLIPLDDFTAVKKQMDERRGSGLVFLQIDTSGTTGGQILNEDPNAQVIPVGPIKPADGSEPYIVESSVGFNVSVISKDAKHADKIIQFMTWLHKNTVMTRFGIEGKHFTYDADGRIQYTEEMQAIREKGTREEITVVGTNRLNFFQDMTVIQQVEPITGMTAQAEQAKKIKDYYAQWIVPSNAWYGIDPDGGTDEAAIKAQVDQYWDEQVTKMLMAKSEAEVEKLYNESIDQMNKIGFDKVMKVMNEKFQANKKKIGIERAWNP